MRRHVIETIMGAVVLVVAGLFIYFAYASAEIGTPSGYPVTARFFKIGGLGAGSDVRISGIKVGTVTSTRLDPASYDAVVTMTIDHTIRLPEDTIASIDSEGLLGGSHVRLEPGRSQTVLGTGGSLSQTRAFRSLEDQVGEIIFLATTPGKPAE